MWYVIYDQLKASSPFSAITEQRNWLFMLFIYVLKDICVDYTLFT